MSQAHELLRLVLGKHKMGIFTLPVADVERIEEELRKETGVDSLPETAAAPPSDTLERSWERFGEEFAGVRSSAPLLFGKMAFYAGAQSFVGVVSAALEDEEDVDAWQRLEGAYEELSQACEELKI